MQWESISSDEIDAMFNANKEDLEIPMLSNEAKMLLLEATKDPAGQILVINSLDGTEIQTNNVVMNSGKIGKMLLYGKQP